MREFLRSPAFYAPALVLVVAGFALSAKGPWSFHSNGPYSGITLRGNAPSLFVGVRWGWPSKAWIDRERLRAEGMPFHRSPRDPLDVDHTFGFGVFWGGTSWYGNDVLTVRHAMVALPWWYLFLIAIASPLEQTARRLWAIARRRISPRCGNPPGRPAVQPQST